VYPEFEWIIMDTMKSSGVKKLSPRGKEYGSIKSFIDKIRNMMYSSDGEKIIPVGILNGSFRVRQSFWDGFYDADGFKSDDKNVEISQKNQISCAHLTFLAYSLGYENVIVDDRGDKPNVFRLRMRSNKQKIRKNRSVIKKLREIEATEYVYDLTTKNHHFSAGIGRMIVHNTDSVMIKMNIPDKFGEGGEKILDMGTHFEMATWLAGEITKDFRAPNDLEFEVSFKNSERGLYNFVIYNPDFTFLNIHNRSVPCCRKSTTRTSCTAKRLVKIVILLICLELCHIFLP
jgi:hypothetical protein